MHGGSGNQSLTGSQKQVFKPEISHLMDSLSKDSALPLVAGVIATDDVNKAFTDIDAAFLVGAMPRREGMER